MLKLAAQLLEYPSVMDMYGVRDSLGPQLTAEIGDVTRFIRKCATPPSLVLTLALTNPATMSPKVCAPPKVALRNCASPCS